MKVAVCRRGMSPPWRTHAAGMLLLAVQLACPGHGQLLEFSDFAFNTTGFACSGCLAVGVDGPPVQIRAMFFEKAGVVQNDAAQRIAQLEVCFFAAHTS